MRFHNELKTIFLMLRSLPVYAILLTEPFVLIII